MKKIFLMAVVILSASVVNADAIFKKDSGKVEFKAKGWPSLLKINGKGEGFSGKLTEVEDKISGELSFDLNTLKTGIDLRDDHLKNKYLKVEKNPTAVLKVKDLELPKSGKAKISFKADLTLNGVTKKVSVKAKVSNKKNQFNVDAEFKIKLSDFKIEIPSFKGITVAEDVEVKVSSKAEML